DVLPHVPVRRGGDSGVHLRVGPPRVGESCLIKECLTAFQRRSWQDGSWVSSALRLCSRSAVPDRSNRSLLLRLSTKFRLSLRGSDPLRSLSSWPMPPANLSWA